MFLIIPPLRSFSLPFLLQRRQKFLFRTLNSSYFSTKAKRAFSSSSFATQRPHQRNVEYLKVSVDGKMELCNVKISELLHTTQLHARDIINLQGQSRCLFPSLLCLKLCKWKRNCNQSKGRH